MSLTEHIDNLLVEYISNPVIHLRDYLEMSDGDKGRSIAYRFPWMFKAWFDKLTVKSLEAIQLEFDADDGTGLIKHLEHDSSGDLDKMFAMFFKEEQSGSAWGVKGVLSKFVSGMLSPRDPIQKTQSAKDLVRAPTFLHMEFVRLVKNDWLIHFSNAAEDIHTSGFKYGVDDLTQLGLTTRVDAKMRSGKGYNFAFLADEASQGKGDPRGFTWKYGKEAVMFRASGILAYHLSDKERQVIFWGPSARDIVYLRNDGQEWSAGDNKHGNPVYFNESLDNVVKWVTSNFRQYRKTLVSESEIVESKTNELPTVMQYLDRGHKARKRTISQRKALADFWFHGDGNDIPRRIVQRAEDAISTVESDMWGEWEAEGYTRDEIFAAVFATAKDNNPDLYAGFFWLKLTHPAYHKDGPLWKLVPESF